MNKKLLLIAILVFSLLIVYAETTTHTGSISLGGSAPQKVEKQQTQQVVVTEEMIRFTPKNGMLPYFEEKLYQSHEQANKILRLVGADPMPRFYPGHNYELPELKTDLQRNLQKRVDYYLELTSIRYEFERQVSGRGASDVIRSTPSQESLKRSREIDHNLRKIDTQIFNDIKNNTQVATRDIMDFVIKRGNRGNISALSNVMTNLKETINRPDNGNIDYDPGSERFSPGGGFLDNFLTGDGLAQITGFIDNVINIIGEVSNLLGTGQEFATSLQQTLTIGSQMITQFHEIFCMVHTMFTTGEAPTTSASAIIGTPQNTTPGGASSATPSPSPDSSPAPSPTPAPSTGEPFTGDVSSDIRFERLMENEEFVDTSTMTAAAIQQFLEGRNSRLKDEYRGQLPSQIIFDVCAQYGINPKVIIATAQKEQSLITRQNVTENTLDWAMGVGCPDNGYHNPAYRGLHRQLESAIRIFKRWYDDGLSRNISSNGFTKRVNYGTANQRVENEATYSLYMYTPHTYDIHLSQRGGGNYLFCRIYIGFFDGFVR